MWTNENREVQARSFLLSSSLTSKSWTKRQGDDPFIAPNWQNRRFSGRGTTPMSGSPE